MTLWEGNRLVYLWFNNEMIKSKVWDSDPVCIPIYTALCDTRYKVCIGVHGQEGIRKDAFIKENFFDLPCYPHEWSLRVELAMGAVLAQIEPNR